MSSNNHPPDLNRFTFHSRALDSLDGLREPWRQQVLDTLELYARLPREEWSREDFQKLADDEPLYLLRIPPRLRLFVRLVEGEPPEVEDIAFKEWLEALGKLKAKSEALHEAV